MGNADRPVIVVTQGALNEGALSKLRAAGEVEILAERAESAVCAAVARADALVIRTFTAVTPAVVSAAQAGGRLKVIGRAGVGLDNIDVRGAVAAGIQVVHTPAASTDAVADLTVGLIVAVQRRVAACDAGLRRGEFKSLRGESDLPAELRHQTVGIIGMGRIGRAVGRRLNLGFGTRIVYHDIREVGYLPFVAQSMGSAAQVYALSDVVTLHVPLTSRTRGMIDAAALNHFKRGAVLINAARGPVLDAAAVAAALVEGRLGGCGVDVLDPEPPPADHPLLHAPNCVLTAHIGARSGEGIAGMNDVVDDVIAVLAGRPPVWPAEIWD